MKINQLVAFASAVLFSVSVTGAGKTQKTSNRSGPVTVTIVGDRSSGNLLVTLENVSNRDLEINEFRLPWTHVDALRLLLVTEGENCPLLTEYTDVTHQSLVEKYIVLPPKFSVSGTINVSDRWRPLNLRQVGCHYEMDWEYEFAARRPKTRSKLKGRVAWAENQVGTDHK